MSTVSILMASYNGKRFIDEQITSLMEQDYPKVKLFILDDCSTDGTYEHLLAKYANDARIQISKNKENIGVIATFEKLLTFVDTEYFCLSDQDDYWKKEKILLQLALLEKTDADLVYSDLCVVNQDLEVVHTSMWHYANIKPVKGQDVLPVIIKNPITGCTLMARSSIINKALPFPKPIGMHDRWLALVAAAGKGIAYINQPTVLYRQHGENQRGTFRFGFSGISNRVKKYGNGDLLRYFGLKARRKVEFLQTLERLGLADEDSDFLEKFYSSPWLARIASPFGLWRILNRRGRSLGRKNITIEIVMALAPYSQKVVIDPESAN